jgi:hypothetical protein
MKNEEASAKKLSGQDVVEVELRDPKDSAKLI